MKKRFTVLILVLALLLGLVQPMAVAADGDAVPFTRGTLCMFLVEHLGLSGYDLSEVENSFTDISPDDPYYDAVLICCDLGWISGTGDGTFAPDDAVIRAVAAIVLIRAGQGGEAVTELPGDVSASSWYCQSVLEVLGSGVMSVDSEGNFRPMDAACPADIDTTKLTPLGTGQEEERLLASRMLMTDAGLVEETGEDGMPILRDFADLFAYAGDGTYIRLYYGTMDDAAVLADGNLSSQDSEILWVAQYPSFGEGLYYIQALKPGATHLKYSELIVGETGIALLQHRVDLTILLPIGPAFYSARERSEDNFVGVSQLGENVGYDTELGLTLWLISEEGFDEQALSNLHVLLGGTETQDGISYAEEFRPDGRYDVKVELAPGIEFPHGGGAVSAVDTSSGGGLYETVASLSLTVKGLPCSISSVVMYDSALVPTDTIPTGLIWLVINLSNFSSVNQDVLIVASYDEKGRMLSADLYPADSSGFAQRAVLDNSDGSIAEIRLFVISMETLMPRAAAVSVGA